MNIIVALLIFTVIVMFHELGHFLLAKKNGIGVPEFSVGMGPRIITVAKTKKGFICRFFCSGKTFDQLEDWQEVTRYSYKLFPIGGSCAMIGEDEENDAENSFNNKGVWARFSVVFAGPFFNFILAFVFSILILANSGIDIPRVVKVYDGQPAQTAGIREDDIIKRVNGKKIRIGRAIDTYLMLHPLTGEDVEIVLERDGKEQTISLDPNYSAYRFGFTYAAQEESETEVAEVSEGSAFAKAGIKAGDLIREVNGKSVANGKELETVMAETGGSEQGTAVKFLVERKGTEQEYTVTPEKVEVKTLGFTAAMSEPCGNALTVLQYSFYEVGYWIETTVASLGQLITGKISVDNIAGPVGIVDTVGDVIDQTAEFGMKTIVMSMLSMAVLLSANLGVMNLLPLPALDGGRLVFILIEAVRRKPIDRTKEGYVHFAGFVLLMLLMIFVMYHDILRILQ